MQASKPIEARSRGLQGLGRRVLNIPELGAGVAVVVFFLLFTIIDKSMASPAGIVLLLTQAAYMGFAAYGMSYLMLAGEIDLSTGAVAGLAAAVAASLISGAGWPEWAALLAALLAAVMVGLLNSFIVLKIGMPSFFATLGTYFVVYGLSQVILQSRWIYVLDTVPFLAKLGQPSPFFGVPWTFVVFLVAVLLGDFAIRRTRLGPILSATGGNRRAAEVSGINTTFVKMFCFVLVSVCAAIAGLFVMNASLAADPEIGNGWQLWVVAIAVIGGSSFSGGVGSIVGGLLGTLLINIIRLGLGAARIQTNAQGVVVGAILVAAAILDVVRRRVKQY